MKSLAALDAHAVAPLRGVLFDLDDTLLTRGVLEQVAYNALWDLHACGFRLVAVTGRPSGWGEVLVRQWPIDGAVTENGAVHLVREGRGVTVRALPGYEERRRRLDGLVNEARSIPGAELSDDMNSRRAEVTWDIGERRTLAPASVEALIRLAVRWGARTTRSSVHLHATLESDDKASGVVRFLAEQFGEDVTSARYHYAFVGDSGNDAPCFAAFDMTFGVANVRQHLEHIAIAPRYVAERSQGEGFAEIAHHLRALRSS